MDCLSFREGRALSLLQLEPPQSADVKQHCLGHPDLVSESYRTLIGEHGDVELWSAPPQQRVDGPSHEVSSSR